MAWDCGGWRGFEADQRLGMAGGLVTLSFRETGVERVSLRDRSK